MNYEMEFSNALKKMILALAREAIKSKLEKSPSTGNQMPNPGLNIKCGAFVTLRNSGTLRGCIGHMDEDRTLDDVIKSMAVMAATSDWRFKHVELNELPQIEIEVSILTPIRRVNNIDDIVVGRDGILLRKDGRKSVFLPQVAVEQGWSLERTLEQLCLKGGFKKSCWKEDSELFIFQAIVFSDSDID